MEPLFLNESVLGEFEKVASIKLSRDTNEWMRQVVEYLHQAYPWIADTKIQVNFNRIDPEMGAGVGQIQLDNKASIPVIIEKFRLAPLDVFWANGKIQPLTKDSLQEVIQGTALGGPTEPGEGASSDLALFSRTQPPYDGRYVYASVLGVDRDAFKDALRESFGSPEALNYAVSVNPIFRTVVRDWSFATKTASVAGIKPKKNMLPKKTVESMTGMKIIKPKLTIKKAGVYSLPLVSGPTNCVVADYVVGMDGKIREGQMAAFELDGGGYCFGNAQEFVGEPVTLQKTASIGTGDPHGFGSFILINKDHIIATEPVRVIYRGSDGDGVTKIAVHTISGMKNIFVSNNTKDWFQMDGDLVLNNRWTFKPIGDAVKIGAEGVPENGLGAAADEVAASLKDEKDELEKKTRVKVPKAINLMKEACFVRPCQGRWFPLSSISGDKLIKVALDVSEDESKNTVDAILGLNFLNPENAYQFTEMVDKLASAKEACAKLLLAARLGMPINQAPLKTAMYALDGAERDLREYAHVINEAR